MIDQKLHFRLVLFSVLSLCFQYFLGLKVLLVDFCVTTKMRMNLVMLLGRFYRCKNNNILPSKKNNNILFYCDYCIKI